MVRSRVSLAATSAIDTATPSWRPAMNSTPRSVSPSVTLKLAPPTRPKQRWAPMSAKARATSRQTGVVVESSSEDEEVMRSLCTDRDLLAIQGSGQDILGLKDFLPPEASNF